MNNPTVAEVPEPIPDALFGRVVTILEQAQSNVVRAVNTNMVLAYWLIGREIVQELQGGEERARMAPRSSQTSARGSRSNTARGFQRQFCGATGSSTLCTPTAARFSSRWEENRTWL